MMALNLLTLTLITTLIKLCSSVTYLGVEQDGKSTYYGGNPAGNACGYITVATSSFPFGYYAACGGSVFNDGYGCGKCFQITCIGPENPSNTGCVCSSTTPSVIISCMDQCPECSDTHFDLDPTAMARIVGPGLSGTCGIINTKVRRVSCEYTTNIKIRAKSGTSAHWYGLHIDDIAGYGSVSSVQLKSSGSSSYDTTCDKSQGPSFWICNGGFPLTAPLTVKLTNDNVEYMEFVDCITNLNANAEFDCGGNYAGGGTPTPTAMTFAPTTKVPTTSPCGVRNIKFVTVTQSQVYWLAFYVEDICTSCGTITNVEVLDSSSYGNYVMGNNSDPRGFYAYDDVVNNHGGQEWTPPMTVRITNSVNDVLIFTDILASVDGDITYGTNNNFCQTGMTSVPTSGTPNPVEQPTNSPINGPVCGNNVKFTLQTGSQMYWLSFFVEELCCGTVTKVEVKDKANYQSFISGETQHGYWYFDNQGSQFTAPITVRVTNSNNEILTFTDIIESVDPPNIYIAHNNFCSSTLTYSPSTKPTEAPLLPNSPTKAPTDPTPKPTNNPIAGVTNNPTMSQTDNPTVTLTTNPTPSPTELQCDDLCEADEDDEKLRIKIIFKLPKWILYDFNNIECWFYNIFAKWFDVFDFGTYFTHCDIDVVVYGGHEHLGDNLCQPEPCLRNKHEIRRMLLETGNDGNISISLISGDDDTYYAMNSFSLDTMSNEIENKFINEFNLDLGIQMESVQAEESAEYESNTEDDDGSTIYVIIAVVLVLSLIVIIVGAFMYMKYRKKRKNKTDNITGTEMMSGEKQSNVVAADDDEEEEEDDGDATNYNKSLVNDT